MGSLTWRMITPWRNLCLLLLCLLVTTQFSALAADDGPAPKLSPLNPEFLQWLEDPAAQHPGGIIPSPLLYQNSPPTEKLELPDRFDLRDYDRVSPAKYQGNCGSCWAFTVIALIEDSMKEKQGFFPDLSENHLIHHHGFLPEPCQGGNSDIALAYFTRWDGPLLEEQDPYDRYNPGTGSNPPSFARPQALVLSASKFNQEQCTRQRLQQHIFEKGALTTTMRWDDADYNQSQNSYYSAEPQRISHGIVLVGWDDNLAVNNAPKPGAWICKNSWGDDWGDKGFFYLSYYDCCSVDNCMSIDDIAMPGDYGTLFFYDRFGMINSLELSGNTSVCAASVFTAEQAEEITAVASFFRKDDTRYTAAIHEGPICDGKLGTRLASLSGTVKQAGYQTFPLDQTIPIGKGDSFTVVFSYQTDDDKSYIPVQHAALNYHTDTSQPDQCYYSSDGSTFNDMFYWSVGGLKEIKACIRALAAPQPDDIISHPHPADANQEGFLSIHETDYHTRQWQNADAPFRDAIRSRYLKEQGGRYDYDEDATEPWVPIQEPQMDIDKH